MGLDKCISLKATATNMNQYYFYDVLLVISILGEWYYSWLNYTTPQILIPQSISPQQWYQSFLQYECSLNLYKELVLELILIICD